MRTTLPSNVCAVAAAQPSAVLDGVPILASVAAPSIGAGGAPVAVM